MLLDMNGACLLLWDTFHKEIRLCLGAVINLLYLFYEQSGQGKGWVFLKCFRFFCFLLVLGADVVIRTFLLSIANCQRVTFDKGPPKTYVFLKIFSFSWFSVSDIRSCWWVFQIRSFRRAWKDSQDTNCHKIKYVKLAF